MFVVVSRQLTGSGRDLLAHRLTNGFARRSDASAYLDLVIKRHSPSSGFNTICNYWWVWNDGVLTRYTIEPQDGVQPRMA